MNVSFSGKQKAFNNKKRPSSTERTSILMTACNASGNYE